MRGLILLQGSRICAKVERPRQRRSKEIQQDSGKKDMMGLAISWENRVCPLSLHPGSICVVNCVASLDNNGGPFHATRIGELAVSAPTPAYPPLPSVPPRACHVLRSPLLTALPFPARQPYAYGALEPHIDEATMKVHHTGHHQAYTDKLNQGIEALKATNPELAALPLAQLLQRLPEVSAWGCAHPCV